MEFLLPPCPGLEQNVVRMKKLIAIFTMVAMQSTPALAWTGGPWSGNTYNNSVTGIFGGSMTMKNGAGIFRFSSTESAQLGAFNSSMIYYKGITFFGSCQATIDFEGKTVDGMTNGSAFNRNPGPSQNRTTPIVDNNPNFSPGTTGANAAYTVPLRPSIVAGEATPANFSLTSVGGSGPVGIANTSWSGKLTSTSPNVRFKAKGEANFLGPQPITQRMYATYGPDTIPPTGDPVTTFVPGPVQSVTVDRGGNDPFTEPQNRVKIRVFGARISYSVTGSIGGTNGSIEGTGGGGFAF